MTVHQPNQAEPLTSDASIYTMALPRYTDRLDIAQLTRDGAAFAAQCTEALFQQGTFEYVIDPPHTADHRLNHIFTESRNRERLTGAKTVGIGFPLFATLIDGKWIMAPLFIWQIRLQTNIQHPHRWTLRHTKDQKLIANLPLLGILEQRFKLDFTEKWTTLARKKQLSKKDLLQIVHQLNAHTEAEEAADEWLLKACPNPSATSMTAGVHWSAVLGIFPPLIEKVPEKRQIESVLAPQRMETTGHPFGLFPLDPHQANAWTHVRTQRAAMVSGVSGTGKTRLLTHIVTNALSNGQKCLIICNKVPALRQIQQTLELQGFQRLQLLLTDALNDLPALLEVLKTMIQAKSEHRVFDDDNFQLVLHRCLREQEKLDQHYQMIRRKIFGDATWTQTVGRFLHNHRKEGKELLASQLQPQDYQFTYDEFNGLLDVITESRRLYEQLLTLKHPLNSLYAAIFTHKEKEESEAFIKEQLELFLEKTAQLHHRYIIKVDAYTEKLTNHYEAYYQRLLKQVTRIEDKIADAEKQFGEEFDSSTGTLALRGVFSKRHKDILEIKEDIARQYDQLERNFGQQSYFDFQFQQANEGKNIPKVRQNLRAFKIELQKWASDIPQQVQEEIKRLSKKTVHPSLDYREQIKELEYSLNVLIAEINEAQLYNKPFENKMLTIPKRQKYLETIIEQLENTRFYLRDHDLYYDWRRHWLLLSESEQKVVKALAKVKPKDWHAAFKSWYLNHCLAKAYDPSMVQEEGLIQDFALSCQVLYSLLVRQTLELWDVKKEEGLRDLRLKNRTAYQQLFGKRNQELAKDATLAEIFQNGTAAITSVLPVLLMTPEVANAIFHENLPQFDWILVDEAHQLPASHLARPGSLGKRIVLFGDPSLSTNDRSVFAKAQELQLPHYALELLHRPQESTINNLQIAALGISPKQLAAKAQKGLWPNALQVDAVEGRFDENTYTNQAEAEHVVRLLNTIEKTPHRTFPRVGIACFTKQQRNLLATYLRNLKSEPGEGRDLVQQLERNGLGIFHVSELYGQHFDALIVSMTFGAIDLQGNMSDQLDYLNSKAGIAPLRLLSSRASQKLFFAHSLPEKLLAEAKNDTEQPGLFLLANMLAFAKASQKEEPTAAETALQRLAIFDAKEESESSYALFMQEVAQALQPYFESSRLHQNVQIANHNLPLVVQSTYENSSAIALQPDGFLSNTERTSYKWEYQRQEFLKENSYDYQPVWSVTWWKNPRREARKLASVILKRDAKNRQRASAPRNDY